MSGDGVNSNVLTGIDSGSFELNLNPNTKEEYRNLLTSIKLLGEHNNTEYKRLLVTSACAGEGASTVAAGMAAGFAADLRDANVLLMDLNLRRPAVHLMFGIDPVPGLIDVISDYERRMEFMRASPLRGIPNLHLLTAGDVGAYQANTLEIIESERLMSFLNELTKFYRFIVIDCAPANSYFDAISLAPHVDGTILVTEADGTRFDVVQRAKDRLIFANANLLGLILNKRKMVIPKAIYKRL